MSDSDPYKIIKHQHVTEKTAMLGGLKDAKSNRSLASCKSPKFVFIVEKTANKCEIARALEEIYRDDNIKVVSVNTINVKGKATLGRGRRKAGRSASFKKAIVTLAENDSIENV
jgi:large subunit ribosomal protein L23